MRCMVINQGYTFDRTPGTFLVGTLIPKNGQFKPDGTLSRHRYWCCFGTKIVPLSDDPQQQEEIYKEFNYEY